MLIATLTANPSVDRTIYLYSLRPGSVNKVKSVRSYAGGKGINVSNYLVDLGIKPHTYVFLGGENGRYIRDALCLRDIPFSSVEAADETRVNIKLIDESLQQTTEINADGAYVDQKARLEMLKLLSKNIDKFGVLVIAGSLPRGLDADFYCEVIELARKSNVKTILDTNGQNLKALVSAKPDMVKPNKAELEVFCGRALSSIPAILDAGTELLTAGVKVVLVSLGGDGSLLIHHSGKWIAVGPEVDVINTVGAGDSMVAAFARSMTKSGWQHRLPDILRHAAACSLVTISKMERRLEPELVEQVASQVHIKEVEIEND